MTKCVLELREKKGKIGTLLTRNFNASLNFTGGDSAPGAVLLDQTQHDSHLR
jgi:hypothetical protein